MHTKHLHTFTTIHTEEVILTADMLQSHRRVRDAAKHTGRYRVEPQLPPDVLGIYVYLPAPD